MVRPKRLSRREEKIFDLYQFYLRYGFDHTIDQISNLMGIGRKTFYNRYKNRENSIRMALRFAHQQFVQQYEEKEVYCNHSVEELVLFVYEFQRFAKSNNYYFLYDREHGLFTTDAAPFKSLLESIIEKGRRFYHINESVDLETFFLFFFFSLSNYVIYAQKQAVLLRYILAPLLNERGLELLDELDLEVFS